MARSVVCGLALFVVVSFASPSFAQQPDVDKEFGKGVHAYYSGKYDQALAHFDTVVKVGTDDPRALYFRGLTKVQLKQDHAAQIDFGKGAELEHARPNLESEINESLQRVQGKTRLALEEIRVARIKKLNTLRIQKMRVNVSTPFNSPVLSDGKLGEGNPNLPDSSKINDPTSPFPNLKRGDYKIPEKKKEEKVDVFGKKDPLNSAAQKAAPTTTDKGDAKKVTTPPKKEAPKKKSTDKQSNPFDK